MKAAMHLPAMHKHLGARFLVHIMKVTRVPSSRSTLEKLIQNRLPAQQALKVTALYCSKQVLLGEFPVLRNECIIDYWLICQLNLAKPKVQSKLHFFIDQACSSGLAGHMALDLKEFLCEGDTEVYLKYPLYAHSSSDIQGPTLKMTIQRIDAEAENFIIDDDDFFVLRHKSAEILHGPRSVGFNSHSVWPSQSLHPCKSTYRDLSCPAAQLRGRVPDTDQGSRSFSCTYSSTCAHENSYEDIYAESSSTVFQPATISKHSRTLSEFDYHPSSLEYVQVPEYVASLRIDEISSDFICSQSSGFSDEDHEFAQRCQLDSSSCSSNVCSEECMNLSLFSADSICPLSQGLISPKKHDILVAQTFVPGPEKALVDTTKELNMEKPRKGPGFLRSLFGAVVVAGVSLLGAKTAGVPLLGGAGNPSMLRRGRKLDGSYDTCSSQTAIFSHSSRRRNLRSYSSPRFSI